MSNLEQRLAFDVGMFRTCIIYGCSPHELNVFLAKELKNLCYKSRLLFFYLYAT